MQYLIFHVFFNAVCCYSTSFAVQSTSTLKHGNSAAVVSSYFDIPVNAFSQTNEEFIKCVQWKGPFVKRYLYQNISTLM